MKRIVSLMIAAMLLVTLLPLGNVAHADAQPLLEVSSAQGEPGDQITVTVSLKNSLGFGGMAYDVCYDNTVLKLISYELDLGSNICVDSGVDAYADKVNFQYAGITNVEGDGVLVIMVFEIIGAEACTSSVSAIPEEGTTFYYEGRREIDFELAGATGAVTVTVTCDHSNKTEVPAKKATCTDSGNNLYYTCGSCGVVFKADGITETTVEAEQIPALGHDYTEATCTAPMTCKACQATEGDALGHSFTNYVSNQDATCTADGTKTAKCDRCDATDTLTDVGSAKGHDYAEATCTAPMTCKVCQATEGDALGHSFTNYVSNQDATCTADGTKTAKCDRCDETDTVADVGSAKGHSYQTAWNKGEEGHWHECSSCGDKKDLAAHDFGDGDLCVICEYERAHIHKLTLVSAVEATCTEAGSKAYYICSGCEDWFEDAFGTVVITDKTSVTIPALGHNYTEVTCITAKTCQICGAVDGAPLGHAYEDMWSKGEEGHWHTCTVCAEQGDFAAHDFGDGEKCVICDYVRAHIHELTLVPAVEATCTEAGSKAYYTCAYCNNWFEDASGAVVITDKTAVTVAALEHVDGDQDGKCDLCGATVEVPSKPVTPDTGDGSNILLWTVLIVLSLSGIVTCCALGKKRTAI